MWTPETLPPVGAGGELAAILAWAPFGGGTPEPGGLPVSKLGLILKGLVFAYGDGSTALISSGSGPVQVFIVGQAPVGNAVIEAIEIDRVILNVGGRREVLLLPDPAGWPPPPAPGQTPRRRSPHHRPGPSPPIRA